MVVDSCGQTSFAGMTYSYTTVRLTRNNLVIYYLIFARLDTPYLTGALKTMYINRNDAFICYTPFGLLYNNILL